MMLPEPLLGPVALAKGESYGTASRSDRLSGREVIRR
jgi:hypothetical protein